MTSALGRATSWPGVAPPASLQGQGLKSLLCRRQAAAAGKRLRAPTRLGGKGRFGCLQKRRRERKGNSCFRALPVWPPRGWSEDGGSTMVPNSECCGKPPGVPRSSEDTRGQPRRRSRLLPYVRGSQDPPACTGAGGTAGAQPPAGASTSAFPAAARPDGAPARGCGPGRWDSGGSGGLSLPLLGTASLLAAERHGLSRPRRRHPGVPCSYVRGCPGAKVGGGVGGLSLALHLKRTEDPSP